MLFVKTESLFVEPTLAEFVIGPAAGAVTVKVKFVEAFAASVPKFQVTIPPALTPLPALTKLTPACKISVAIIPPAIDGPELVMVNV